MHGFVLHCIGRWRVAWQVTWSHDNKIVLVTGASSGLGRELCLDLAEAGCEIIAAARRVNRLQSLCDQINQSAKEDPSCDDTIQAEAVELDVTADGHTIQKAVEKAWAGFGHIDVLINNAGIIGKLATSSIDLSEDEWDNIIKTNFTGSWQVANYFCVHMRDAGRGGSIINISSITGLNRPQMPGNVSYGSSKAGLDAITRHMALELGKFKIRINSIAPGIFPSKFTEYLSKKDGLKNVALRSIPLGTFVIANPALTSFVRYLIHDSSNYISGNLFIC